MEKKFTFMEQKDSIESLENKIKDINVLQKKIVPGNYLNKTKELEIIKSLENKVNDILSDVEITSQELENRKNKVNNILNNAKIISQELKSVELNLIKTYTPSPPPKKRPEDYIRRWNFEE